MKQSTFLIKSTKNKSFGTSFVVHTYNNYTYLITCTHVVEECSEDSLEVDGKKAILLYKGSSNNIDLAVIYVEGLEAVSVLNLCFSPIKENTLFQIKGFKPHKRESFKFEILNGYIQKISALYSENKNIKTYELSLHKNSKIEKGYSGSAIQLQGTNTVIAVATDRHQDGKSAYAIPIIYLQNIWEDLPTSIDCEKEITYKNLEKKSFFKKIENQALNTVGGVIILALITGFLYDAIKPKEKEKASHQHKNSQTIVITGNSNQQTQKINETRKTNNDQTIELNGSNNIIKQEININNDKKRLCEEGISTYQETINELNNDFSMAKMSESKKIINRDLNKVKKQLSEFKKDCD